MNILNNNYFNYLPYVILVVSMFLDIKFNSIAIILLLLFSIVYYERQTPLNGKLIFFFSGIFFFNFFHFYNNGFDFGILESSLSYFIFPLIFILKPIVDKSKFELILKTFLFCNIGVFLVCLGNAFYLQYSSIGNLYDINWFLFSYHDFARMIDIEPVYLSIFSGFSVFISFSLYRNTNRSIYVVCILALILFQIMLTSRTPLIATFVLLIINVFQTYSFKKSFGLMTVILLVFIMLISFHSVTKSRFISTFIGLKPETRLSKNWGEDSGKLSDRTVKWESTIKLIKRNVYVGVGSTNVKDSLVEEYKKNNYSVGVQKRFDPHNQYLTESLSNGIFSGIFLTLTLLVPCLWALKHKHILYSSFLMLVMFSFLTESVLIRQKGLVFYCFFNALLFAYYFYKRKEVHANV